MRFSLFVSLYLSGSGAFASDICQWHLQQAIQSEVIGQNESHIIFLKQEPQLESSIVSEDLLEFQNYVLALTEVDPIYLLKRQMAFYQNAHFEDEVFKFQSIINGEIGVIRPIQCLESLLYGFHKSRRTFNDRSEFLAYIFEKDQSLKILMLSSYEPQVSQPSTFNQTIDSTLNEGWSLRTQLHNHPFSFDNPYGDISGTTIPSGGDTNTYKYQKLRWGFDSPSITNGFHTIVLDADDIDRL